MCVLVYSDEGSLELVVYVVMIDGMSWVGGDGFVCCLFMFVLEMLVVFIVVL